jgi:hypothetical protein
MKWQEEDLSFLKSAAIELSDYLNSTVFEWPMRNSRISLTPGRVLISMARLSSIRDLDENTLNLITTIKNILLSKNLHWIRKIEEEFPRRLKVWENLIDDYVEEGVDKTLPVQIINRVILRLLEMESPVSAARYSKRVITVDAIYKKLVAPNGFLWEAQLESVFSENDFWFLYSKNVKG